MSDLHVSDDPNAEYTHPPFLYEIRVKGHLSAEQWSSWFDDLTVSTGKGESSLRGSVPDHAALYGLLARLRDLAVPLVSVKVLDADAQRKLSQRHRRVDLMLTGALVLSYLLLAGGLSAITVFIAPMINTALALMFLFAVLGGLAHAFWLWSAQQVWRWVSYVMWPAAAICLAVYIPISGILPVELGIAIPLLVAAGGLIYLVSYLRRRRDDMESGLPSRPTGEDGAAPVEDGVGVGRLDGGPRPED